MAAAAWRSHSSACLKHCSGVLIGNPPALSLTSRRLKDVRPRLAIPLLYWNKSRPVRSHSSLPRQARQTARRLPGPPLPGGASRCPPAQVISVTATRRLGCALRALEQHTGMPCKPTSSSPGSSREAARGMLQRSSRPPRPRIERRQLGTSRRRTKPATGWSAKLQPSATRRWNGLAIRFLTADPRRSGGISVRHSPRH